MIEAILIAIIVFGLFALGWLAQPIRPDPPLSTSDCCFAMPDIPDTPNELLLLAEGAMNEGSSGPSGTLPERGKE
jgi:hypothetical protein